MDPNQHTPGQLPQPEVPQQFPPTSTPQPGPVYPGQIPPQPEAAQPAPGQPQALANPAYQPQPTNTPPLPGQDYSVDYLDQIAPETKQTNLPYKLILIILGIVGALVIAGILMMLSSNRPSTLDYATELNARLVSLADVAKKQHKYLSDNPLRASNTAYQLFLNNAITDLKEPLAAAGLDKEAKKALKSQEKEFTSQITTKFEDARLNAVLDRAYALEMSYQISLIENMMHRVYKGTNNQKLHDYLDNALANLTPIAKSFREFSDTTSRA